jgi:tetratricopeptide (TPR) repeat protein
MSKQRKPAPSKPATKSATKTVADFSPTRFEAHPFFRNVWLQSGLIFALAFLLYANTLTHGFVLDDAIVITDNMYTTQGVKGVSGILSKDTFFGYFKEEGKETLVSGGRYRPMTLVLFALVYQLVGANPFVFHLLTVLLFALTCVVLYHTLRHLFARRGGDWADMLAWLATVLFVAHPIHTEVVANIKGCDEIVTLLGSLGALFFVLKSFDTGQAKWAIAAGTTFFLACLSKENAAAFVVLIPLALWFFRSQSEGRNSILKASLPIFVAFAAFFVLRGNILHWRFGGASDELMNNPFLKIAGNEWVAFSAAEKLATIFYTMWKYVQLLVVPHPLTHDYYPRQIGIVSFANPVALLGLALYAGLAWYAIRGIGRRTPLAFAMLMYLLPLGIVSNFLFPIGTNMGERFAFMPSVGFCLAVALLTVGFFEKNKKIGLALGIFGAAVALFALKTLTRNPAWSSNERLFFADAKTSTNSAKLQNACGGVLFDRATKETNSVKQQELCSQAIPHLDQAIKIYPNYKDAYVSRAGCHYVLQDYDRAIADYRVAMQLAQDKTKIKTYLALALRDGGKMYGERRGDLPGSGKMLNESWQLNPTDAETARLLGVWSGVQSRHADAIQWFSKAVELNPKEASYLWDLGLAHSASGDLAKGAEMRERAVALNPKILEQRSGK